MAQRLSLRALEQNAGDVTAWDVYAQACVNLKQPEAAVLALKKAISLAGGRLDRVLLLGRLLVEAKQWQEAADIYEQVVTQDDSQADAWFGLGECFMATKDPGRAAVCYLKAVEREPGMMKAQLRLAVCCLENGENTKALYLLTQLAEENPASSVVLLHYGLALSASSRYRQAQRVLERITTDSDYGQTARRRLAEVFLRTGEFGKAEKLLDSLGPSQKSEPDWVLKRARLDNINGENKQACERLRLLLERDPSIAGAWQRLLDITNEPLEAVQFRILQEQAAYAANKKRTVVASEFQFALARHYELLSDWDNEFLALKKANNLKLNQSDFDYDSHLERILTCRHWYSEANIRDWAVSSESLQAASPIFILSLPRSGSTLVEQILGAHSGTQNTGEADLAQQAWSQLTGYNAIFSSAEAHRAMSREKVEQFRDYYLQAAQRAGFDTRKHLINKAINNHQFAGLLKAAFPDASFIDLRRNVMDVALGCYRKNFSDQPFSFSLENCAREVALFYDNMRYWRSQLSDDAFFRLDYEKLVEDFENQVRELLAFCGLEWQEQCLEFHKAKGKVSTASINQVSQGLFKQGVARWRKYEKHLGPLIDALERQGLDPLAE